MTSEVHTHDTEFVPVMSLTSMDVLVGESGGLSAVYNVEPSNVMMGCLAVETEHGTLYLDADEDTIAVLRRLPWKPVEGDSCPSCPDVLYEHEDGTRCDSCGWRAS